MIVITLFIIGGLIMGALIGGLWTERRARTRTSELQTQLALAQQLHENQTQQAAQTQQDLAAARDQAATAARELATAREHAAALESELRGSQTNLSEQRQLLADAQNKLTQAFATVSMETLAKNNEQFLQMAEARFKTLSTAANLTLDERKAQIEGSLKPLQTLLAQYQLRLGEIEKSRSDGYGALQKQLGALGETQRNLTAATHQLNTALTRPQVRGSWGEISLRKLAELSGMTDRCDFIEQANIATDAGNRRPDMVVQMPEERIVVVDCKAVLGAFLDAAAAPDDATRAAALRRHSTNVRARARDLASKAYWAQFANTPEFVVLFLPGESFLYAAVEQDATLIDDCLAMKVILATPTTFLALLKTVEYGWKQEAASRNAEKIEALGVEIYERLATVASYMAAAGASLNKAVEGYNAAVRSMDSRLLSSARKMSELGVRNKRELPDELPAVDTRVQEPGLRKNAEENADV